MGYTQVNLLDKQGNKVAPNTVSKAVYDEKNGKTAEAVIHDIQEELGIAQLDANGHEYVDLGLPSGTLWAKCNVGANVPEGFGKFFAWGEVIGYDDASGDKKFKWDDYKYGNGGSTESDMTKYNATDGKTELDLEDDAARVNMGGSWRMPTEEQMKELITNTTVTWANVNGVNGRKFTNKSDSSKYIFIPAANYYSNGSRNKDFDVCFVWSSSLDSYYRYEARFLNAYAAPAFTNSHFRHCGLSVRGVLVENSPTLSKKADKVVGASEGDISTLDATGNLVDSGKKITDFYEKKEKVLIEEDGLYQIKDNSVYPVAHPDLSTQPSILPQRFGNLDIKEVLIAKGREDEIPANAMVISAFSFNKKECCAATVKRTMVKKQKKFILNFSPTTFADANEKYISTNFKASLSDFAKMHVSFGHEGAEWREETWGYLGYFEDPDRLAEIEIINDYTFQIHSDIPAPINDFTFDEDYMEVEGWSITNEEGIDPDFTLVRYVGADNGYYYSGSDEVPFDPTVDDTDDGEAVDLGLPSGTKWAKSNLGGSKPSDYGNYYQWGDTQGYPDASNKQFKWADYKYSNNGGSSESAMTKYNASDGKTVLDNSDDAAYAATSGTYKMPTDAQLQELYENTIHQWVELPNGVNGRKFVNKNDASKYIFIPGAGGCGSGSRFDIGDYAFYWSSSLFTSGRASARFLGFGAGTISVGDGSRSLGFSVRGVLVEN